MIPAGALLLPLSLRRREYNQFVQVDMCFHFTATLLRSCYRYADYPSKTCECALALQHNDATLDG
jgi:hypothetical protein